MKRFFITLALAFLALTATVGSAEAQARWQNYGADPAYASKEAAKADAAAVFRRAGWPPEVVAAMVERMRSTPPERITLRNGDRLDFMRTGPSGLWRNVLVDFVSHGRGVEVIVHADRWTVTVGGVTYEAILPDVCNNLAGRRSAPPPEEPCVYIVLHVEEAGFVNAALMGEQLPSPECSFSYQGPGTGEGGYTFQPNGYTPIEECRDRPCDWSNVVRATGQPVAQSGSFRVTPGNWVVRVDRRIAESLVSRVVFCLTTEDGRTTYGLGVRRHDYREAAGNTLIATIWPQQAAVPTAYAGTELWWRWYPSRLQLASR